MNHSTTMIPLEGGFHIKNVQLLEKADTTHLFIRDGMFCTRDTLLELDSSRISVVDAEGCYAVPGLVDLYSRCREPGLTRKGNIASESAAALSAGFTQVLCSPDTVPAVDNVATVELVLHRSAQTDAGASIIPMAALTAGLQGQHLSELATLQSAGCPVASQADRPIQNTAVLYSAMQYAHSFGMTLLLNARDSELGTDGCAHTGAIATQLGLPTIPVAAETIALARLIELCKETGCKLHISRISAARSIHLIEEAKNAGLPITCDVGIHHLFFSDDMLAGYDASFHSAVPFRGRDDLDALRKALSTGVIDAICTDHAPHDIDAGLAPFPATEPGLSAYDWFVPLLLQLPDVTGLSLGQIVEKLHAAPLKILGKQTVEPFSIGTPASFFILDTNADFALNDQQPISAGANHPLRHHDAEALGLSPLKGNVRMVFNDSNACCYQ